MMSEVYPIDDNVLLETFLGPVRKCAGYLPAFGQGRSVGLEYDEFRVYDGRHASVGSAFARGCKTGST